MNEPDIDFVHGIVSSIVEYPDDVKIERRVDEMGVLILLSVHRDDMGRVIGKAGATAKALRTLLHVLAVRLDSRINLKILEPDGSERQRGPSDAEMFNKDARG